VLFRSQALISGELDPNNLDNRQVTELAKVLDRILSGGSPTISGTEHLTPDTARMKIAKLLEYSTNERKGAQAGDFVKNIAHTLEREKAQANTQIQAAQKKLLGSYGDLKKKDPEKWDALMKAHNLDAIPSSEKTKSQPQGTPGTLVKVKGKMYKIGDDGDTLEEVM
jgi:hypothetical protein